MSFVGWACTATRASFSGDSLVLSTKRRIMLWLPLRLCDNVGQYNLFAKLCNSDRYMNHGFLAWSRSREDDWNHCKSSWYHYDFDVGLSCCDWLAVEPGHKHSNNCAVLPDRILPKVPLIFVEGESMSLLEAKSRGPQFLEPRYFTYFEDSPAADPE